MLINIIVTVLRETLEAGVLISLLIWIGKNCFRKPSWLIPAFMLGIAGAITYALNLEMISNAFNYVGQELLNAALHIFIFCGLVVIVALFARFANNIKQSLGYLLVAVVALALVREGGELFIFYSGYMLLEQSLWSVFASGFMGLFIGASVGALFYYLLIALPQQQAKIVALTMLCFIGAGMLLQATQLLIQADWVNASYPLWDTNHWLAENSVLGQLVYAIFGYEATPTAAELIAYSSGLSLFFLAYNLNWNADGHGDK